MDHADADTAVALETNAAPAFSNPEFRWISDYFKRLTKPDRYDGFGRSNDHSNLYFDHRIHPETRLTRACLTVQGTAFGEIAQDYDLIYVPCGISSGLDAHEALSRKNSNNRTADKADEIADSTYKADETLGNDHPLIIARNKNGNLRRGRITGLMHPHAMVIPPVINEAGVRALKDQAFARGQRYEEEDCMALWFPAIDRCRYMVLDGDWNFSRNSIWEMMRGTLIQAGLVPSRPDADMDVLDLQGRPLSLLWRAEKMVETLQYQLGKGFDTREAATALAQMFAIHDDILSGALPLEGRKLHSILRNRPAEELRAMEALKEKFKPVVLDHCAQGMRLEDLPREYHDAAKQKPKPLSSAQQQIYRAFAKAISERKSEILSVRPSPEQLALLAKTHAPSQRQFDSYERFFEKRSQSALFEDNLYAKLPEWERLALPFAIGATEIALYPTAHPMATAVFTDLKRGAEGFRRAQEIGIDDMNEFAGAMGRETQEIIAHNLQAAEALKAKLKADEPGRVVVNTPSFLRIADAIERCRPEGFVAAEGPSETSPSARLALQMKYLDRNVDRAVFQDGWAHSNDLVQLRVRARLIQAGLIERPHGPQSPLKIFNMHDPNMPQTLLDDISELTQEVRRVAEAGVKAPEQALALARLVALHELLVEPSLSDSTHPVTRELIGSAQADETLTCYDRQIGDQLAQEAKQLLKKELLFFSEKEGDGLIPFERLYAAPDPTDDADHARAKEVQNARMQEYIDAQRGLQGQDWQRVVRGSRTSGDVHVTQRGQTR